MNHHENEAKFHHLCAYILFQREQTELQNKTQEAHFSCDQRYTYLGYMYIVGCDRQCWKL